MKIVEETIKCVLKCDKLNETNKLKNENVKIKKKKLIKIKTHK